MLAFIYLITCLSGDPIPAQDHSIQIDFERGMDHQFLQLTPDSILVSQHFSIHEVDLEGKPIRNYTFEKGYDIANYTYLRSLDLIAVVLGRKNPYAHRIKLIERHDEQATGTMAIPIYDRDAPQPENVYVRQIIETASGRLFANIWSSEKVDRDQYLLQEIQLEPYEEGYALRPRGKPFSLQQRAFEAFPSTFKRRFLVDFDDDLRGLGQLQPLLKSYKSYVRDRLGKRPTFEEQETALRLYDWVQPYLKKGFTNREERRRWRFSFSRNIGLYPLTTGKGQLLLGYMSPNPDYRVNKGLKGDDHSDVPFFVLNVQRLSQSGKLIGEPIQIPGAYLVGLDQQGIAYILRKGKQDHYKLCLYPID